MADFGYSSTVFNNVLYRYTKFPDFLNGCEQSKNNLLNIGNMLIGGIIYLAQSAQYHSHTEDLHATKIPFL